MSAFQQGLFYLKHGMISLCLIYMGREGECSENNSNRHWDQSSFHFSSVGCFNHSLLSALCWAEVLSCTRKRLMLKSRIMWKWAFVFVFFFSVESSGVQQGESFNCKTACCPFLLLFLLKYPYNDFFSCLLLCPLTFPFPCSSNGLIFLELTFLRCSCSQQLT